MKFWTFLTIAIMAAILLLWGSREGFNPSTERPEKTNTSLRRTIDAMSGNTTSTDAYIVAIQSFYDTKYLPKKETPSSSVVSEFVNAQLLTQGMTKDVLRKLIEHLFLSIAPPSSTTTGSAAGGTTGGSSTSSAAPNSGEFGGGGDRRQQVFGPIFRGIGEGGGVVPMDSSKTNRYPELMGGKGNAPPSTRVEGAGITTPSKSWQMTRDGTLPTSAGLGSDENSKFLPFSRQPGDMDLIPDPYRVSQQFSASNYAFKTEPVPFLTDFSAFQK
jgi:hypothetical protein